MKLCYEFISQINDGGSEWLARIRDKPHFSANADSYWSGNSLMAGEGGREFSKNGNALGSSPNQWHATRR